VKKENETPKQIAKKLGIDINALVELNLVRQKGLTKVSQLKKGTRLFLPSDAGEGGDPNDEEDMKIITSMTDEVGYRHWTFYNDDIEYTESSYMMADDHLSFMLTLF
jgi:hypothetical protein